VPHEEGTFHSTGRQEEIQLFLFVFEKKMLIPPGKSMQVSISPEFWNDLKWCLSYSEFFVSVN
jgi:hypothetical protein